MNGNRQPCQLGFEHPKAHNDLPQSRRSPCGPKADRRVVRRKQRGHAGGFVLASSDSGLEPQVGLCSRSSVSSLLSQESFTAPQGTLLTKGPPPFSPPRPVGALGQCPASFDFCLEGYSPRSECQSPRSECQSPGNPNDCPVGQRQSPRANGQSPRCRSHTPRSQGASPQRQSPRGESPRCRAQSPRRQGERLSPRGQSPRCRGQSPRLRQRRLQRQPSFHDLDNVCQVDDEPKANRWGGLGDQVLGRSSRIGALGALLSQQRQERAIMPRFDEDVDEPASQPSPRKRRCKASPTVRPSLLQKTSAAVAAFLAKTNITRTLNSPRPESPCASTSPPNSMIERQVTRDDLGHASSSTSIRSSFKSRHSGEKSTYSDTQEAEVGDDPEECSQRDGTLVGHRESDVDNTDAIACHVTLRHAGEDPRLFVRKCTELRSGTFPGTVTGVASPAVQPRGPAKLFTEESCHSILPEPNSEVALMATITQSESARRVRFVIESQQNTARQSTPDCTAVDDVYEKLLISRRYRHRRSRLQPPGRPRQPAEFNVREDIWMSPEMQNVFQHVWARLPLEQGVLGMAVYIYVSRHLYRLCVPQGSEEECDEFSYLDWISESRGLGYMTMHTFSRAMFSFVDTWCENVSKESYLMFATGYLVPIVQEDRLAHMQALALSDSKAPGAQPSDAHVDQGIMRILLESQERLKEWRAQRAPLRRIYQEECRRLHVRCHPVVEEALPDAPTNALKVLRLSGLGLPTLAPLLDILQLSDAVEEVQLKGNCLEDQDFQALLTLLLFHQKLRVLDISFNPPMSDQSVTVLHRLIRRNTGLTRVRVKDTVPSRFHAALRRQAEANCHLTIVGCVDYFQLKNLFRDRGSSNDGKLQIREIVEFCDRVVTRDKSTAPTENAAARRTRERAQKLAAALPQDHTGGPEEVFTLQEALLLFYPRITPAVIDRFVERYEADESHVSHARPTTEQIESIFHRYNQSGDAQLNLREIWEGLLGEGLTNACYLFEKDALTYGIEMDERLSCEEFIMWMALIDGCWPEDLDGPALHLGGLADGDKCACRTMDGDKSLWSQLGLVEVRDERRARSASSHCSWSSADSARTTMSQAPN